MGLSADFVIRRSSETSSRLKRRVRRVGFGRRATNLPDEAANVAAVYAAMADDVAHGSATVPDFGHARRLARLMEELLRSAASGTRTRVEDRCDAT